jgi:hypothetical protein
VQGINETADTALHNFDQRSKTILSAFEKTKDHQSKEKIDALARRVELSSVAPMLMSALDF